MSKNYIVNLVNTAQFSIQRQIDYLAGDVPTEASAAKAWNRISPLVDHIHDTLSVRPYTYPVAPELAELGITQYRRMLIESYRVFYEVDEAASTVNVMLFVGQRQDVVRALQDYAIIGHLP